MRCLFYCEKTAPKVEFEQNMTFVFKTYLPLCFFVCVFFVFTKRLNSWSEKTQGLKKSRHQFCGLRKNKQLSCVFLCPIDVNLPADKDKKIFISGICRSLLTSVVALPYKHIGFKWQRTACLVVFTKSGVLLLHMGTQDFLTWSCACLLKLHPWWFEVGHLNDICGSVSISNKSF